MEVSHMCQKDMKEIKVRDRKKKILSSAQMRFWFINLLKAREKNTINFNMCGIRIKGNLNLVAFNYSLNKLFERQDMLRATIKTLKGKPEQIIFPYKKFKITTIDVSTLNEEKEQINKFKSNQSMENNPTNMLLIKKCNELYTFIFSMHHCISDGWSFQIFLKELTFYYSEYVNNNCESTLPSLVYQYYEFTFREKIRLFKNYYKEDLIFWKKYLKGQRNLPVPLAFRNINNKGSSVLLMNISEVDSLGIRLFCKLYKVTLFVFMISLIQYAFFKIKPDLPELNLGIPVSGREEAHSDEVIGCFVNTIIIRKIFNQNEHNLDNFIINNKKNIFNTLKHQCVPYEQVIKYCRESSLKKGYRILFSEDNTPLRTFSLGESTCEVFEIPSTDLDEDMAISYRRNEKNISIKIHYKNIIDPISVIGYKKILSRCIFNILRRNKNERI
jgi:polyketide synthase PksJ